MIEPLLPAVACAEMFHDVPESTMFPIEAAVVKGAVAERRREFGTVRHCARKALQSRGARRPDPSGRGWCRRAGRPVWSAA